VSDGFEAVLGGNPCFNFAKETFVNLNDTSTARANQMVMMPVIAFVHEFEPGRPVAKIKPSHHAHFFQQVHGTVNGREVALAFGHGGQNFAVRQRMRMPPEYFQNRLARAGDFSGAPAEASGQNGKRLGLS
jgi:hypothetical protein